MNKYRYAYTGKTNVTITIPRSATLQELMNYFYPARQGYRTASRYSIGYSLKAA